MTFPSDDDHLVKFLRQNRPDVPPAAPNLEAQIMQTVAVSPQSSTRRWQWWVVPPVIAASLLMSWAGYRTLIPTKPSAADLVKLEAFLVSNWDGVTGESEEAEWGFP